MVVVGVLLVHQVVGEAQEPEDLLVEEEEEVVVV